MPPVPYRPRYPSPGQSPEEVVLCLGDAPGLVWLDSAGHRPEVEADGAISILTANPVRWLKGSIHARGDLQQAIDEQQNPGDPGADWGFPTSGWFGTIDYDGTTQFGFYPEVLIYRHATGEWLATGTQLPEAVARAGTCQRRTGLLQLPGLSMRPEQTPEAFQDRVRRAQQYIAAGDIYQVNLAHRFSCPAPLPGDDDSGLRGSGLALALRLRTESPAPYAAFLDQPDRRIISSSPESFLKMSGRHVRTRPIKGTRPRFHDAAADERSAIELMRSEKERAELLMITDLLRNDLGQVCEFGSVRVTDLVKLERYEQVFHLVSTIEGRLCNEVSQVEALAACFPGGSITGAPKRRAREIISELEPCPRGLYTGAIGYFGSNGESQFSIAIRTMVCDAGTWSFHTGAGVVADSIPEMEWEETLHKAAGLLAAVHHPRPGPALHPRMEFIGS